MSARDAHQIVKLWISNDPVLYERAQRVVRNCVQMAIDRAGPHDTDRVIRERATRMAARDLRTEVSNFVMDEVKDASLASDLITAAFNRGVSWQKLASPRVDERLLEVADEQDLQIDRDLYLEMKSNT